MRAVWTASGACTNGSTAPPGAATRRASGGVVTMSTGAERSHGDYGATAGLRIFATCSSRSSRPESVSRYFCAAFRRQRAADYALVQIHVGDGRDGHAWRLDDVNGMDADARTDVGRRRGVVRRYVDRNDGGDDAAIPGASPLAPLRGRAQGRRNMPGPVDGAGGHRVLARVDHVGNGRFSAWCCAGDRGDAAARAGTRRSHGGGNGGPDGWHVPIHLVEGTPPCLLPGVARPYADGGRRRGVAARP